MDSEKRRDPFVGSCFADARSSSPSGKLIMVKIIDGFWKVAVDAFAVVLALLDSACSFFAAGLGLIDVVDEIAIDGLAGTDWILASTVLLVFVLAFFRVFRKTRPYMGYPPAWEPVAGAGQTAAWSVRWYKAGTRWYYRSALAMLSDPSERDRYAEEWVAEMIHILAVEMDPIRAAREQFRWMRSIRRDAPKIGKKAPYIHILARATWVSAVVGVFLDIAMDRLLLAGFWFADGHERVLQLTDYVSLIFVFALSLTAVLSFVHIVRNARELRRTPPQDLEDYSELPT